MSSDDTCIEYLFNLLNDISGELISIPNIKLYFKPHPISNFGLIQKRIESFNDSKLFKTYFIVDQSIEDILAYSDLVIGIKTGSIFEFITNGVPCIVIADNKIIENPIPNNFPSELWELTYSSDELYESIVKFVFKITNKFKFINVEDFARQYFNIPDRQNVNLFLSQTKHS